MTKNFDSCCTLGLGQELNLFEQFLPASRRQWLRILLTPSSNFSLIKQIGFRGPGEKTSVVILLAVN
jgi:hypothetical protein